MLSHSWSPSLWRLSGVKKTPTTPSLRRQANTNPTDGQEHEHTSSQANIPLPQGVWWLKHANVKDEAAYGHSFVIHRRRDPPKDIVVASQEEKMVQVWHPHMVDMNVVLRSPCALLPPEFDSDAIDVEVEEVEPVSSSAIVFAGTGPICEKLPQEPTSRRRTRKVKFTCNRCRTRTEKFINPHAWNHGVVFCRCDGCKVVHLIQDRKGVFSCLKGPLFPQALNPNEIRIPDGLPQNPVMPDRTKMDDDTTFWLF